MAWLGQTGVSFGFRSIPSSVQLRRGSGIEMSVPVMIAMTALDFAGKLIWGWQLAGSHPLVLFLGE